MKTIHSLRQASKSLFSAFPERHRAGTFLRRNLLAILLWPAGSLLLAILAWTAAASMLESQRSALEINAQRRALSLSRQYAAHLRHSIDQIDQIVLNVKYQWESTGRIPDLNDQRNTGLYPASAGLFVSVIDQDGKIVSSTVDNSLGANTRGRAYFGVHKAGLADGLYLSGPSTSLILNRPVIHFSRRSTSEDGSFAGIVLVSVEPAYLAPFVPDFDLGNKDFMVARNASGTHYTKKVSGNNQTERFFRIMPAQESEEGVRFFPGTQFTDHSPRYVGWSKVDGDRLIATAGVSQEEALATYAATSARMREIGYGVAGFLVLISLSGMLLTVSVRWRGERASETMNSLRLAMDDARDGFYMVRPIKEGGKIIDFEVADCNARGAAYYGMTREALLGRRFSDFRKAGAYVDDVIHVFIQAIETGYYEDELETPPLSPLKPAWVHRRLVRSYDGIAVTLRDITESKAHALRLSRMANEDSLTTLPNRHWLTQHLPQAIARAKERGTGLALLFIDLDNFKDVNDTMGHDAGDQLLQVVAARLRCLLRPGDEVVRLGGDEFNVVLSDIDHRERALQVAERIAQAFEEPIELPGNVPHRVHASIGISVYPDDGTEPHVLLKHADIAMYEAKAAGKRQFRFFHPDFSAKLVARIAQEQALQAAIENEEFVLYYQPRVSSRTGKLISMEALVRWRHPVRGIVAPGEFIGLAERTGLIVPLGEIVIKQVCAQLAAWREQIPRIVPVSVNVAARQLNEADLGELFARHLSLHALPAALLEVEVTESDIIDDNEITQRNLCELKRLGIKRYVDDFGTGYSSLYRLQRLRLDGLKVDRAFTASLTQSPDGEVFYKAIVSMARALNMTVVAEGVETPEELTMLQQLQCDEVQGYLVSRPVPATDVPALLDKPGLFPLPESPASTP